MTPLATSIVTVITTPTWDKWVFYSLFLALASFEFLGVFDSHFTTITAIICRVVPGWARALAVGWIAYHFLIQHPS
jgi:hypothetical protein